MSAYTKNLITANGMMVGMGWVRLGTGRAVTTAANGKTTLLKHAKNVTLFFAAPFIGLAYLLAFPVIGIALLLWIAGKAAMNSSMMRPIALATAAPFVALAFVTVGPIVALGALACTGARAFLRA